MTTRRKPESLKQFKKKPIVPKWKVFRAKDPTMSVFMWGINHAVS
jgi:hypothetical protein